MDDNGIIGFYVSSNMGDEKGALFRKYVWNDNSIGSLLNLDYKDYGKDLMKVLFQFYVNPIAYELDNLKEIENYRKREKAIGIPIIINDNNFFNKDETERSLFLKDSILHKLDLLKNIIENKKLDTKVDLLKLDINKKLE